MSRTIFAIPECAMISLMKNHERLKLARDTVRASNVGIGARVGICRRKALVSMVQLARALGYRSVGSIYQIESGAKMISAAELGLIAAELGVTIRALYPKGSVR